MPTSASKKQTGNLEGGHAGKHGLFCIYGMNKELEFLWYFDDEEELEFLRWCKKHRCFLELLRTKNFTLKNAIDTQSRMLLDGECPDTNLLYHCLELGNRYDQYKTSERSMYLVIAEALGAQVLGYANVPDCVVNGIPVEAKKGAFNTASLKQLKRYMDDLRAPGGIAASPCVEVDLPNNIFHLRVTFNEQLGKYEAKNPKEALEFLSRFRK